MGYLGSYPCTNPFPPHLMWQLASLTFKNLLSFSNVHAHHHESCQELNHEIVRIHRVLWVKVEVAVIP